MMKTLVVPLDGTDLAPNTLSLTAVLARALGATVELTHVVVPSRFADVDGHAPYDPTSFLERARASFPADLDVHIIVDHGDPVEQTLERVRREPRSVLVIPSRGRAGLSRTVFGSVSDQIVRTSPVPVIVTREGMRFPRQTLNFIVVPLDSSPLSERALPWAVKLARTADATIGLVSVIDVNQVAAYAGIERQEDLLESLEGEARDLALSYLDDVVKQIRSQGVRVTWEVRLGRPADEIIRAAETTAADLIVMSTHGRGGIRRWAFGSVTDDVLQRGDTPVLVVPS